MAMSGPVIGFDLDQTLVDSLAGIARTLRVALAGSGVAPTEEQVRPFAGLRLEDTINGLAPGVDVTAAVLRYRARYAEIGVPLTRLMPGAAEAVAAVRAAGGRALVVSAKAEPGVRAVLARVGLAPDAVAGGLFGVDKGPWLASREADAFVGDHPADMRAARNADAVAVGVATGAHPARELRAGGADVVLGSLAEFPAWFDDFEASSGARWEASAG